MITFPCIVNIQATKLLTRVLLPFDFQMFFKTSSSPSKLIPIAGGSVSKFVRGMGNVQRILVPQARLTQQNTLRHIAPRLATSINPTRPPMNQVKVKPATSRAGKQVCVSLATQETAVLS